MVLVDTNVLIEAFKGNETATSSIVNIGIENVAVSSITAMELYFGALNKRELADIRREIEALTVLHINNDVSHKAMELVYTYSKSHYLQIPDAIIAAQSIVHDIPLMTYNVKDFSYIRGLEMHKA